MSQMPAAYLGPGCVAMIGRTSQDSYGLWKIPVQSLEDASINTEDIKFFYEVDPSLHRPATSLDDCRSRKAIFYKLMNGSNNTKDVSTY